MEHAEHPFGCVRFQYLQNRNSIQLGKLMKNILLAFWPELKGFREGIFVPIYGYAVPIKITCLNGRWFIARRKIKSPIVLTLLCPEDRVGKIWPYSQLIVSRTCALSIFFHEYLLKYVNLKYEVINKVSSINMKLPSFLIFISVSFIRN